MPTIGTNNCRMENAEWGMEIFNNTMRFISATVTIITLLVSINMQAQDIQITAFGGAGLGYQLNDKNIYEPGFSGAGIKVDLIRQIDDSRVSLINGLEFSFQGWGSQVLANNGFSFRILNKGKIGLVTKLHVFNGIVLLKSNPLYVGGIEILPQISYSISEKISIYLNSGFRYSACPRYRQYGPIWSYFDVPVGLGVALSLEP